MQMRITSVVRLRNAVGQGRSVYAASHELLSPTRGPGNQGDLASSTQDYSVQHLVDTRGSASREFEKPREAGGRQFGGLGSRALLAG